MLESEELFAQSMKTTSLSNPPRCAGNWARTQNIEDSEVIDWGPYRTAKSPVLNPGKMQSMSDILKVSRVAVCDAFSLLINCFCIIDDLIIRLCCCIALPRKTIRLD